MTMKELEKNTLFNEYIKHKYVKFWDTKIENINFDDLNGIVYFKSSVRYNKTEIEKLSYDKFKEYLYVLNIANKMQCIEKINNDSMKYIMIENDNFELEILKNKINFFTFNNDKDKNIYDTIDLLIKQLEKIRNNRK